MAPLPTFLRRAAAAARGSATALMRIAAVRRAVWTVMRVPFDPFDPAIRDDPYPFYRRLRERSPLHYMRFESWLITRYADAVAVLRDGRFGHPDYGARSRADLPLTRLELFRSRILLARNPPDHTRLRSIVTELLTPAGIEAARPRIQAKTDRLLDRVADGGRMDVIEDLAYPLTMGSIGELIGIPADDLDHVRPWVQSLAEVMSNFAPPRARLERADAALERLSEYFEGLLAERRRAPRRDLLSRLVEGARDGRMDADELLATSILLFAAGYETTVGLIGNGLLALLCHPDDLRRLREDPGLIRSAIEECLRYDAPVQMVGRVALEDVPLAGRLIRRGQQALVLTGAANRDPARFPDPDRFDIARRDNRHLGFGSGIHMCLGQVLARSEGQVAIGTLVRRFPRMELVPGGLVRFEGVIGRGIQSLPIVF